MVSQAQLHLIFNHFPLAIFLVATPILLFGIMKKYPILVKTALWVNIFAAFLCVIVFQSGEGAEEVVEHLSHVSHHYIEEHEEVSENVLWLVIISGVLSLLTLVKIPKRIIEFLPIVVLIVNIIALLGLAYSAHLGGRISHPELRQEFTDTHSK